MNIKQGEVWLADLSIAAKTRPVVIVSRYDANPPRVLVIIIMRSVVFHEDTLQAY